MQYLVCPRCHFRAPFNKHICTTCGYNFPPVANAKQTGKAPQAAAGKAQQNSWWQQFLGLNNTTEESPKEPAAEEPALG